MGPRVMQSVLEIVFEVPETGVDKISVIGYKPPLTSRSTRS